MIVHDKTTFSSTLFTTPLGIYKETTVLLILANLLRVISIPGSMHTVFMLLQSWASLFSFSASVSCCSKLRFLISLIIRWAWASSLAPSPEAEGVTAVEVPVIWSRRTTTRKKHRWTNYSDRYFFSEPCVVLFSFLNLKGSTFHSTHIQWCRNSPSNDPS